MKITASKLAAARLAAAEVFIAEGLEGTNWEGAEQRLRDVANCAMVGTSYHAGKGWIDVDIVERHGKTRVVVETQRLGRMSPEHAEVVAKVLQRAVAVARKVEAAIAEAVR
jgi:hypothetical protein